MDPRLQRRVQRYGWDRAAGYYEDGWRSQLRPAQDRLLEVAELRPGESVVDVACGNGLVTFRAADAVGPEGVVVGTDISKGMIELAREVARERAGDNGSGNVTFERMDAEELTLPDESFDAALSALGLMYYPDPVKALKEMKRVLVSGGRAVAAVWGQRDRCGWADIFPIVDSRVNTEVCPLFFHLGTGETLEIAFETAGFEDIEIDRLSVKLHYESDEHALGAAFAGGPVAMAYSRFDEPTRKAVHSEYLASIRPYRVGVGYEIPGEFVVGRGVKPAN